MSSVNGSIHQSREQGAPHDEVVESEWREHFVRTLGPGPRFPGPRRFLHEDIALALDQAIHRDASVLQAGVGGGKLLASLPNDVRWGIDTLREAIEQAGQLAPSMQLSLADAATCSLGRQFDAIVCDRLCHTERDIQRLLQN